MDRFRRLVRHPHLETMRRHIINEWRHHRVRLIIRSLLTLGVTAVIASVHSFWTPDTLLIMLVVAGLVFGQGKEIVKRFVPFMGLLVVYDSMRSWANKINPHVNYEPMIAFDKWIGAGTLPTQKLQEMFWHGYVQWYDFAFYTLYMFHFLVPVVVGVVLWKFRTKLYWPFAWTIIGISFIAFIIFVLFPAAPPWYAFRDHFFGGSFERITSDVWWAMGVKGFSEIYSNLSPNEVAAVPSLHSAYPLVAAYFLIRAFGWRRMWWVFAYPIAIWVGVVYSGEHYVFDVICGAGLALAGCLVMQFGLERWHATRRKVHKDPIPV